MVRGVVVVVVAVVVIVVVVSFVVVIVVVIVVVAVVAGFALHRAGGGCCLWLRLRVFPCCVWSWMRWKTKTTRSERGEGEEAALAFAIWRSPSPPT